MVIIDTVPTFVLKHVKRTVTCVVVDHGEKHSDVIHCVARVAELGRGISTSE
jgi:hypothetical protein